jgi:TPR repeat protein
MSDLAYVYTTGEGVPKDKQEAARWFERAAANGHPGGMRNYAFVLDHGDGVERNPKQAAEYLLTAFRMGSDSARKSLFELSASWHTDTKAELQKLLGGFGFYKGKADGEFGEDTFAALKALQISNAVVNDRAE